MLGSLADGRKAVFATFRMRDACAAQTDLVAMEKQSQARPFSSSQISKTSRGAARDWDLEGTRSQSHVFLAHM